MTLATSAPALRFVRLPGAYGPILRCSGELNVSTVEALRRELALVLPLGHPALTIDLAGCRSVDVDGILTMLQTYKELRRKGSRLVIVAGTGRIARLLEYMGIERIIPLFPDQAAAAEALRGGAPAPPAPALWEEARATAIAHWSEIQEMLGRAPVEEVMRRMTAMTALCERSEELFQQRSTPADARCRFCPLFREMGGESVDLGCRSVLDPMLAALQAGDTGAVREQVADLIRTLEEMPLAEKAETPIPWLPSALGAPAVC